MLRSAVLYVLFIGTTLAEDAVPVRNRMLGGEEEPEHPFMASITEIKDEVWTATCLGSIIHVRWILTSGICVIGMEMRNVFVELGSDLLHGDNPNAVRHTINGMTVHPEYNTSTGQNDIALLSLNQPIIYTFYISFIRLSSIPDVNDIKLASMGWGVQNDTIGDVYHALRLRTLTNSLCQSKLKAQFPNVVIEADKQICGFDGMGKDLCQKDEGGPVLAFWKETEYVKQVGIFSSALYTVESGWECSGRTNHPLVFTRVSAYIDWINKVSGLNLTLV